MKRLLISLALLTGCAGAPPPAPLMPASDTCGASAYAGLIGAEARDLERVLILRPVRLLRPGETAGTPRSDRLTFIINATDRITRLECS